MSPVLSVFVHFEAQPASGCTDATTSASSLCLLLRRGSRGDDAGLNSGAARGAGRCADAGDRVGKQKERGGNKMDGSV